MEKKNAGLRVGRAFKKGGVEENRGWWRGERVGGERGGRRER